MQKNPDSAVFCEECGIELGDLDTALDRIFCRWKQIPCPSHPTNQISLEEVVPSEPIAADRWPGWRRKHPIWMRDSRSPKPVFPRNRPRTAVPPASLTLISFGQSTDTVIPLEASPLMLGKFDPAQGPIDIDLSNLPGNEYLSRRHGELFFDDGWTVRDLGSTNGVFVRRSKDSNFLPRLQGPHEA